jgi:hypothetical protein
MFGPKVESLQQLCLKGKLNAIKTSNWTFKAEISDFNWSKLKLSARESKITTHFANHLKMTTLWWTSIEWIERVFKINVPSNNKV